MTPNREMNTIISRDIPLSETIKYSDCSAHAESIKKTNICKGIKEITNKDESTYLTEIPIDGKIVNSPKKLAHAFNNGYHKKSEKTRESFTETHINPIAINNEVIITKNENYPDRVQGSTPNMQSWT